MSTFSSLGELSLYMLYSRRELQTFFSAFTLNSKHTYQILLSCLYVCQGACCQPTGPCWWRAATSWRPCSAASTQRPAAEWCPSTASPRTPSCPSWSTSTLTPAVRVSLLHAAQVYRRGQRYALRLTTRWTA